MHVCVCVFCMRGCQDDVGISDNDSVTVWSIWTVDGRVCGGVSRRYLARRNRRSARSSRSLVAPSDDAGAPHPYPSRTHRYIYPPLTPHDSTPPPLSLHTTKQPGDRPPTPRRNIRRLRSSPRHGRWWEGKGFESISE